MHLYFTIIIMYLYSTTCATHFTGFKVCLNSILIRLMFLRRRGIVNNNAISFGNLLFLAVIDNIIYYIVPICIMHNIYYVREFSCTIFEVLFKRIMHIMPYKIDYNIIISYIIEVFHIIIIIISSSSNIIKHRRPHIIH